MYCKIYHIDNDVGIKSIQNYLDPNDNCNVVTDSLNLKNELIENGFNCKFLPDIFPDVDPTSSKIYQSSVENIDKYKKILSKINYNEISIFPILEPILREELVLINKFHFLLNQKQNLILIFKTLSHSLFLINKLALENNFETIHKTKITNITKNETKLLSSIKEKISLKKKLFLTLKKKSQKNILKLIDKKINFLKKQYNLTLFFLTPSTRYVLNPIFSVVKEFQKNNSNYHMISFDHNLVNDLTDEFLISDFSRDALILSSVIKNNSEGNQLIETILKISKENDLNAIIFDNFINPKIYNIFRLLAIFEITKFILHNTQTNSTVIGFDGNSMGNSITSASKSLKIPSYSICSLAIINNPLTKFIYTADKILIYGNHGNDLLQKFEYDPNKIIITGNIMYEYFSEIKYKTCKYEINSLCDFNPEKPLIVLGSRWYPNDDDWITKFIHFCNIHDFNILIKVHPLYLTTNREIHQYMIQKINDTCKDLNFSIQIDISPSILLPAADLVITDESQLGIEAGLLGKPWITKNFNHKKEEFLFEMYDHLINSIHVTNYDDLEKITVEILRERKHSEQIEQNRFELMRKFHYHNDHIPSEEIFSIITNS
jgi:hypothetical protein